MKAERILRTWFALSWVALLAAGALAACGGSSHAGGGGSQAGQQTHTSPTSAGLTTTTKPRTTASGSQRGSDSSSTTKTHKLARYYGGLATFGTEASGRDRAAIVATVKRYLDSVASGNWNAVCGLLSTRVRSELDELVHADKRLHGAACPTILGALSGHLAPGVRQGQLPTDVQSVRLQGGRAFVLYRTKQAPHVSLPVMREGGEWRLDSLSGASM